MKATLGSALRMGLISAALLLSGSVAQALDLFWTNENTNIIQGSNLDGSNLTTLVSSGLDTPRSIAFHNDALYFADFANSAIKRADLNGTRTAVTGVTTLFSGSNVAGASGISIDSTNGEIYYTRDTLASEAIWKANLDGSGSPFLVLNDNNNPRGIALDVAADRMYWLRSNTSEAVLRATLAGASVTELLATAGSPKNIALDIPNSHIYYTNNAGGDSLRGVFRLNFDGTGSTKLIAIPTTGFDDPTGIALDLINSKMYITDQGTNNILSANLDGTGSSILNSLSGTPQPYDIAIVPEPSTYALMFGLGALLFALTRRHLKSKAQEII